MSKGIIVTSFGTTDEEARKLSIKSIEDLIRVRFKDYIVLRAFTSKMVTARLKEKQNYIVYNLTETLEKMKAKKIKNIYIQPLLIIAGVEYDKIIVKVSRFLEVNKDFNIKIGKPLLSSEKDYENTIKALNIPNYNKNESLVLMGHGTHHKSDIRYEKIQSIIKNKGYNNVFLGTLSGQRTIEYILSTLKTRNIRKVDLKPFMLIAGSHVKNDMASDKKSSWKTILERNNIKVNIISKGLGENRGIQEIFIDHLREII